MPMCTGSRYVPISKSNSDVLPTNVIKFPIESFDSRTDYIASLEAQGYEVKVGGVMPDKVDARKNILYNGFVVAEKVIWFPESTNKPLNLVARIRKVFTS